MFGASSELASVMEFGFNHRGCVVQVTARGAMPCCAMKKLARIFSRVVRQFDGLGGVDLDRVVCPGCVISQRARGSSCVTPSPAQCFLVAAARRAARRKPSSTSTSLSSSSSSSSPASETPVNATDQQPSVVQLQHSLLLTDSYH